MSGRFRGEFSHALLLRGVDYGDADRIVTLLTSQFGKASYLARNARRSKRRFGGALSPLSLLEVEVGAGRGQLGTIAQARVTRAFPRLLSDLRAMGAAYGALELVRELLPEQEPSEAIFLGTVAMLDALDAGELDPERLLVAFQVHVMALAGFAPGLTRCGLCGKLAAPQQSALFDARQGHLVCRACGGAGTHLRAEIRARLAQAAAGDWLSAAAYAWVPADLALARTTVRALIEHRIGKRLTADTALTTHPTSPTKARDDDR